VNIHASTRALAGVLQTILNRRSDREEHAKSLLPGSKRMQLVNLARNTLLVLITLHFIAHAQEKLPTKTEVDALFENVARQTNSQASNSKVDDFTTLKVVTYDKGVPVFTYHYVSTILKKTGRSDLTQTERDAMFVFHQTKTCNSHFRAFMIPYGLKVTHTFEDQMTGRNLITLTYGSKDCR
jgi:hypothetical protein